MVIATEKLEVLLWKKFLLLSEIPRDLEKSGYRLRVVTDILSGIVFFSRLNKHR